MLNKKGAKIDMLNKQTQALLNALAKQLDIDARDLKIKVSAELEFYIVSTKHAPLKTKLTCQSQHIQELVRLLKVNDEQYTNETINIQLAKDKNQKLTNKIRLESFEEEDGFNQFEVQFIPTENPLELAENINNFKEIMPKLLENCTIDFRARPFENEPTSSLHFHISIYYKDANLFAKENPYEDDEYHYLPLYWCIAGILELTPKCMKFFAPTENCKTRYYMPKKNQKWIHYPTRLCWGFNNRTCAIRIPKKPNEDPLNCRIEHRVSSSMADPFLALFAIFAGMQYGVAKELDAPEPVYERAYEKEENGKLLLDFL